MKTALICVDTFDVLLDSMDRHGSDKIDAAVSRGFDVDTRDGLGRTLLMKSIIENRADVMRYLIESGAEIDLTDSFGWTPLLMCCVYNAIDCAKLLIAAGADIDKPDYQGFTPAMFCVIKNQHELLEVLIEARVDTRCVTEDGQSIVAIATTHSAQDCLHVLLRSSEMTAQDLILVRRYAFASKNKGLLSGIEQCRVA